jgi:hypothetical protein
MRAAHDGNQSSLFSACPARPGGRALTRLNHQGEFINQYNGIGKICSPRTGQIFFNPETPPLPCPAKIAIVEVA